MSLPIENPQVAALFERFPAPARKLLLEIRRSILAIGKQVDSIGGVDESIKWGEPSYSTIAGSPIRLGWSPKSPDHVCVFFHCQTKLVSTFRILYPDTFVFDGNRCLRLPLKAQLPKHELAQCIELALNYHKLKKLPLLGASN